LSSFNLFKVFDISWFFVFLKIVFLVLTI